MAIDARIALGVQPVQQQPNMLAQYAQVMGIKAAQQEMEGNNALRDAYASGGDLNDPEFRRRVMAANPKLGSQLIKTNAETGKLQNEAISKRIDLSREMLTGVNTPEDYLAWHESNHKDPVLGGYLNQRGVTAEQSRAKIIAALNSPGGLEKLKRESALGATTLQKELMQTERSVQVAGIGAGATMRGQDITDKRMREQLHPIETGMGPGTYQQFGPNAGVINPMTQAPWQPRGAPATTPNIPSGGLGSGTYGMGGGFNTLPATVGAATPVATSPNMMLQGAQPPATAPTGYTQATPKGPASIINVNTQTTASEEAQKQFMQSSRITYDQLKQAPTVLENIEKAKALVPIAKGFMGTGGETMLEAAKFMNNRLGTSIDTAGIKSAEELNSRLFMGIMDNLKKMDAQPSQQQQAAMKQALGNLGTDPNAMNAVLDVFGDIVRGKVDIHNTEVMGAEARGVKFPYNPVIKLKERTPASTGDIATDAGVAKVIKSNAEFDALPSGAIFTAPDGTTRRKP